jgi:tetratricopeptide (TPR) repeat protein
MSIKKSLAIIGTLVLLLGIAFGISYYMDLQSAKDAQGIEYVLTSVEDGSYDGELPPLDYVPMIEASFPEDARAILISKVTDAQERLAKYPYDGNTWMELALHYHTVNDYRAAEAVWAFITSMEPVNVTALGNLGRLYHFELKEYEKAEKYFLMALEANPERKEAYFDLLDLYRYSYKKDTTAAVDIMRKGEERFPDDTNFLASLGTYFRDSGRPNQARAEFQKALDLARTTGDMNLIQGFTAELSRL